MSKGDVETIPYDFSAWGTVSSATWSLFSGSSVSLGTPSLASNVATIELTITDVGKSTVKLVVTDGTKTIVEWLSIKAEEPQTVNDYGVCY